MKTNIKLFLLRIIPVVIVINFIALGLSQTAYADDKNEDTMIVVSMGDSYSSGEGVEPFYGQEDPGHKTDNNDWLAHRSAESWPAKLVIPGYEGSSGSNTMGDYKYDLNTPPNKSGLSLASLQNNCVWYFVAASGAKTEDVKDKRQDIEDFRQFEVKFHSKKTLKNRLPLQTDVFKNIEGTVDFVTITIGGNDVEFSKLIKDCAMKSTYLGSNALKKKIFKLWLEFGNTTRKNIYDTYIKIGELAPEANIIVAGYPKLFEESGKGAAISYEEADLINSNVSLFNDRLEELVGDCKKQGMKIHFVDVEEKFSGHEAYTDDPWINEIILGPSDQELDYMAPYSKYSMHPNGKGTDAYAECVNELIKKICNSFGLQTLAVGADFGVAAIKNDGTVQFDAINEYTAGAYKEISSWKNVKSIGYGQNYIIALLEDGTLEASVSSNGLQTDYGQCKIEDWKDIQQIAVGLDHTVGLRSDGTVAATGNNEYGQCNVSDWKDITMIAAGGYHTVGLKADGTVVATGRNPRDEGGYADPCTVDDWTKITKITAGHDFTAGVREDGTVKVTHIQAQGFYPYGIPEEWDDVKTVAAGCDSSHLLALKEDGSVIGIGPSDHGLGAEFIDVKEWSDMCLLACGRGISVGVTEDGTVLMVGMEGSKTLGNLKDVRVK